MIILHIAPLKFNKSSGLTYAVPPLISYQSKNEDIKVALLLTSTKLYDSLDKFDFTIFKFSEEEIGYDLCKLPEPFNLPDLVVFHSTYIMSHFKIARQLVKRKIPYIITPHGGMTNGAQSVKKLKKMLVNLLYFNKVVRSAIAIHCLSKVEADETKRWNKDTFIVGNGMSLPDKIDKLRDNGLVKITFIGRLEIYIKGLDLLLAAISLASESIRKFNCEINIYGPDRFDSKSILEKQIYDYNISDIVKVDEPVYDDEKIKVLNQTDVFVLTSRFEGHPMGVLEAMAYGIPCLLTPGTSISKEVKEANAGWEVEATAESIAYGIEALLNERDIISIKGQNARKLVNDRYSWKRASKDTINYYESLLLNRGDGAVHSNVYIKAENI